MDLFNFLVSTRKLCFEQVLGHELAYQLIYTFDYVFHRMKIFLGRQEVDGFVQETSEWNVKLESFTQTPKSLSSGMWIGIHLGFSSAHLSKL